MPKPSRRPPEHVLRKWFDQELTHKQMLDEIQRTYGTTVTRRTLGTWLSDLGLLRRPNAAWLVEDWPQITHEWASQYPIRMIRVLGHIGTAAVQRGEGRRFGRWYCNQENPDPEEDAWIWGLADSLVAADKLTPRSVRSLKNFVRDRREEGTVVYYHPQVGFKYSARRPGIDKGLTFVRDQEFHLRLVNL